MKSRFLLVVALTMLFFASNAQTVLIDIQESGGGCALATDCETNYACFDLLVTVNQSGWQLASYNIWTEYPAPPIMNYVSDNSCLTQNGGDTDNNTQGQYRVGGINGLTVLQANVPTVFHTICYAYSDELEIRDSLIASGGTLNLYNVDFSSTITLVKVNTGQTYPITIDQQDFLNLNSNTLSCLISEISLEKELVSNADNDGSGTITVGDVLTYTITATNMGNVRQENVVVSDAKLTPATITCAELEKDETCILTGTYLVTQADVDAGQIVNTATVVSDLEGPVETQVITPIPQNPEMSILKTLITPISGGVNVGDVLSYSVVVTNTGNMTLTNVTVSDPYLTPNIATCPTLSPGSTCTLNGIFMVSQDNINDGFILNIGTGVSDQTAPVTDELFTPLTQEPEITTVKTMITDISGGVSAGDIIFYSISTMNTGNVTLHNVTITDPMLSPNFKVCPESVPGCICTLIGYYVVKQADIDAGFITNTATGDSDETPPQPVQITTPLPQNPEITTVKTLLTNISGGVSVGDYLSYSIVVTNTGNTTLHNVSVSDPMLSPSLSTCSTLAPTMSCTLTGNYLVTQTDVDAGQIVNNATGDSYETDAEPDQVIIPITQNPEITLVKSLLTDISGGVEAGDVLSYSITATNTGNITLHNIVVSDALLSPSSASCVALAPAESCVLTGDYVLTQNDINNGSIVNTGFAISDETTPVSHQIDTPLPQVIELTVNKTVTEDYYFVIGDQLHYTIEVLNSGNVTVNGISVSDPIADPGTIACNGVDLEPGELFTCQAIHTITQADIDLGVVSNIATASGIDPDGNPVNQPSNQVQASYGGPLPDVFAGADAFFCENGYYLLSNATVQNASSVLWQTSGNGTFDNNTLLNATYYPGSADLGSGTVTLTINAYPIPPAVYVDVDIIVLTLMPLPVSDAGFDFTVCANQNSVNLAATALDGCGNLWTTSGNGAFDDNQIVNPVYTFGSTDKSLGSVELCLKVLPCSPCAVSHTNCVTITLQPLSSANAGSDVSICGNQTAQLNGTAQNYSSVLWDYAAPGQADGSFDNQAILNPVYTPGTGDVARGYANVSFTALGVDPCTVSSSDIKQITVYTHPEVFAGADGTVCEDGSYTLSNATATHFSALSWSGNVDNPTILHPVYTPTTADIAAGFAELCLTAQPINPCTFPSTDCLLITIQRLPVAFAGPDMTICQGEDCYLAGAFIQNAVAIQWIPLFGAGSFSDELIQNPVYYPNPGIDYNLGCVTLQVIAFPNNPCSVLSSDQMELCFDPPAKVDAGADATICEDAVFTANPVINNGGAVNWTHAGDGAFDDPPLPNASYTPGPNDVGNFVVLTISVNSTGACDTVVSDDIILFVAPAAVAFAGNNATICEMINLPPVSFGQYHLAEAYVNNACGQSWSTSGDGDFDFSTEINPTYTLGADDVVNGSVELCFTAGSCSPCLAFSSHCLTLTVQHLPAADAGSNITICGNEQAQLNGTAWNFSGVYWDYAIAGEGDGIFSNQSVLNPTYTPGVNDIARGYVNLVLVAIPQSPCLISDSDVVHVTIFKQPDVIAGADASICQGQSFQLSAATASDYSSLQWSGGTGTFSPSDSVINPIYLPASGETGSISLCLTAQPLSPCDVASTDCLQLFIQSLPQVEAGVDFTLVYDQGYTVSPVITGTYSSVSWSHNGTGSFDDPSILNATYFPGAGDEGNAVTLILSVLPGGACLTMVADYLQLTFDPSPIIANNDTGTPVTGASGGVVVNVLTNDDLNGLPVDIADVVLTQINSTSPNVILNPITGEVLVLSGTPEGTYFLVYQICEIEFPLNCDQATVIVEVTAAPIEANDDTGIPVNGMTGGETLANVLVNDLLDGSLVNPDDVTLSFISSTNPGITLNTSTGAVNVAPGIPAGIYLLVYEICEVLNPANCAQATVTVEVTEAPIIATNDAGTPVSGINGGEAVANVLVNDTLGGLPVDIGDILLTQVSSTNSGIQLNPLTGAVNVAPGTPQGTYFLVYQICEILNPTNCAQATVTVIVTPATLAANDDIGIPVNGMDGGVAVITVLVNDMLNGSPVDVADITLTEVNSTNPGVSLNPATGEVIVAPGTPAGTYYLVYQICENINPTNCEQATVTVIVTAAPIVANDDTGIPVNGMTGGQSFTNVLTNDELNNLPVDPLDIYLTQISTTNPGVTLDPLTGAVNVAPGTPAGTYSLVYEICEILNPSNCDPATVTFEVTAAPIAANNDTGLPVNGMDGGQSVANVLLNDLLNNLPVDPADILLSQISTTNPGVTLDPLTGVVNVAPGTPAGIYELVYEICEVLNPSNCDQATVTVTVTAAPIVANDDIGIPVNGFAGGHAVTNVLTNDLLNNVSVDPADVTLSFVTSTIPGVTLDLITGSVNVVSGTPAGVYELVYEICEILNPANCDQATVTVPVLEPPVVDFCVNGQPAPFGALFDFCETDLINITVCNILKGVAPFNICFEINGAPDCATGVNLNEAIFTGNLAPGVNSIHITSIQDANNYWAVDVSVYDFEVVVTPQPFAYAGDNANICIGEEYFLSDALAENFSSFYWTGGDGNFIPNNLDMNPVYAPGVGDTTNGSVQLCLVSVPLTPCSLSTTDCMTLSIYGAPVVNAGDDATICETGQFTTSGSASNYTYIEWSTAGDGFFFDANELITDYKPGADDIQNHNVELCLNAISDACTLSFFDCLTLYFVQEPEAFAGNDALICAGDTYTIGDASGSHYSGVQWMTFGDGQFSPSATVLNPEYIPGNTDIENGTVELCLTTLPSPGCTQSTIDCMILNIVAQPSVELPANVNLDCSNYDLLLNHWMPIPVCATVANDTSLVWTTSGDGTFVDSSMACTEYILGLHDSWDGEVTLTLTATGHPSCSFIVQDQITMYVPIQLIDHNVDNWWGISSYVNKTATSVPDVMFPIVGNPPGSTNLIIMVDKTGKYYWPEGVPPSNQLGNLQPIGYKMKIKNTPSCLPIYGDTLSNQTFLVNGAFTYVPVLTNVASPISTLFAGHLNNIRLIYEFETSDLWTPVAFDFDVLKPGRAYLLVSKNATTSYTIEFPNFDPLQPISDKSSGDEALPIISPWNEVIRTSIPHALIFAEEVVGQLSPGDVIGVFNSFDECTGITRFNNRSDFFKLIAMGKDAEDESQFGFEEGEPMRFKLFRDDSGEVFDLTLTFDNKYPNFDGKYAAHGLSRVVGISMNITSVGELETAHQIKVFPNPATEIVNVQSMVEMKSIQLVDNIGQVVHSKTVNSTNHAIDVDQLPAGIYFVHIMTITGEKVIRMIAVN